LPSSLRITLSSFLQRFSTGFTPHNTQLFDHGD